MFQILIELFVSNNNFLKKDNYHNMKTRDQQLLEEAYTNILFEQQISLLEEGKIKDFLKANFNKLKGFLSNPKTLKFLTTGLKVAAPIIMALSTGDIASAAEGLSNIDLTDLWQQFTDAMQAGDATTAKDVLQKIDSSLWDAWKQGKIQIDNPGFDRVHFGKEDLGIEKFN